jgi:hypothetical protein
MYTMVQTASKDFRNSGITSYIDPARSKRYKGEVEKDRQITNNVTQGRVFGTNVAVKNNKY